MAPLNEPKNLHAHWAPANASTSHAAPFHWLPALWACPMEMEHPEWVGPEV